MSREPKYHKPIGKTFDEVLGTIANEHKPEAKTLQARPFVKWVGGKRSIVKELTERMPEKYNTYVEPFLGGGAFFFHIQPDYSYLSDINLHLVVTFLTVKNDVERLIQNLKIHSKKHNKDYYMRARERMFKEKDRTKIAALFIYLNKTCYNGLYRVNKSGQFNVPMGEYKNPAILDEDNLRSVSKVLKNTIIKQHDFMQTEIKKGDFYYLDPPYHKTFDGYNGNGFGDEEHRELAELCKRIDKKGGYFMLSNSNNSFVKKLYKGYNIEKVSASRSVSCKAHQRGKENELIIRNYK